MKLNKILITAVLSLIGFNVMAQDILNFDLKLRQSEIDSTSYLLGINFGSFIKDNGFTGVDRTLVRSGLNDFIFYDGEQSQEAFLSSLKYNPTNLNETLSEYVEAETRSDELVKKTSYLVGIYFGTFIEGNGFPDPNLDRLDDGITAYINAEGDPSSEDFVKQFEINPECMGEFFPIILAKQEFALMEVLLAQSESFLAQKKEELSLQQTPSGLLYQIITPGDPDTKPLPSDTVTVLYRGTNMDGSVFDEHMDPEAPMSFVLSRVIDGWTEGLQLIGEGGKIMLYVHPDMAYGSRGAGEDIAPYAALVFEISLLKVSK